MTKRKITKKAATHISELFNMMEAARDIRDDKTALARSESPEDFVERWTKTRNDAARKLYEEYGIDTATDQVRRKHYY